MFAILRIEYVSAEPPITILIVMMYWLKDAIFNLNFHVSPILAALKLLAVHHGDKFNTMLLPAIAGGNSIAGSISGDMSGMGDIVTIPDSNGMGGMSITREISIVSRGTASNNGGWL